MGKTGGKEENRMPQSGLDELSGLLRNLEDAGCDEMLIQEFMRCREEENSYR